jgi:acyl-CoA reductase-like NAD-dependent aldehyde dehydrogenase
VLGVWVMFAEGGLGFGGQRSTANRRVIVDANCYKEFLQNLETATTALIWGDPLDPKTQVGPMVSVESRNRVAELVARARQSARVIVRHENSRSPRRNGAYFPPAIVCCDDPTQEIVQEETFGPVLVVQRANDWEHAIRLCNGVRQGLVAAIFSRSKKRQAEFLEQAQAGILKINSTTANANAEAPFGGWKGSGIGPPEHGRSDREFYTRTQSIYV